MKHFLWLFIAVLISGCASTPAPKPGVQWKSVGGQVRYADAKRTFVADVSIRVGANSQEYSMEVNKAGAILLKLDRAGDQGWATGPLAHWPFSGPVKSAGSHLKPWFESTSNALSGASVAEAGFPKLQFRLQR